MKGWILNPGFFGKLSCALMIHDIPATLRDRWQRLSHKYFRNWIGLASSAEPSVLYRSRENFGLQFRNFRQLTKELGVIKNHILKYSKDGEIRKLYRYLLNKDKRSRKISNSLRKFIPEKSRKHQLSGTLELEQAERCLKFELVRGKAQSGTRALKHNLGDKSFVVPQTTKQFRKCIVSVVKKMRMPNVFLFLSAEII